MAQRSTARQTMAHRRRKRSLAEPQPGRAILAHNLKKWRRARKLSQTRLAEVTGLNRTFLSLVENGHRNISIDNICRIAAAFAIHPQKLLDDRGVEDI